MTWYEYLIGASLIWFGCCAALGLYLGFTGKSLPPEFEKRLINRGNKTNGTNSSTKQGRVL
jgi:hypothetical protein